MKANEVINGTWGEVWINDEPVDEIGAFQAKYEFEKEDVNIMGDMFLHKKFVGYSGTGSMTLKKTNSRMIIIHLCFYLLAYSHCLLLIQ